MILLFSSFPLGFQCKNEGEIGQDLYRPRLGGDRNVSRRKMGPLHYVCVIGNSQLCIFLFLFSCFYLLKKKLIN